MIRYISSKPSSCLEDCYYYTNETTITVHTDPTEYKRDTGILDRDGNTIYVAEKKQRMGYL